DGFLAESDVVYGPKAAEPLAGDLIPPLRQGVSVREAPGETEIPQHPRPEPKGSPFPSAPIRGPLRFFSDRLQSFSGQPIRFLQEHGGRGALSGLQQDNARSVIIFATFQEPLS